MTVILLRHGVSTSNLGHTLAGRSPGVELAERGFEQAVALAERLSQLPIAQIVRSPLLRCERTVAPLAYTIPMDGPVGELLARTNVSELRPAHIHFRLEAPGYHPIVTHLFRKGDPYLDTDVVYAVKEPLITEFVDRQAGAVAPTGESMTQAFYEVRYDFALQPFAGAASD